MSKYDIVSGSGKVYYNFRLYQWICTQYHSGLWVLYSMNKVAINYFRAGNDITPLVIKKDNCEGGLNAEKEKGKSGRRTSRELYGKGKCNATSKFSRQSNKDSIIVLILKWSLNNLAT